MIKTEATTIRKRTTIPNYILNNVELNIAISKLPSNYDFEIHKTIHMIKKYESKIVALQFPEGLLMYFIFIFRYSCLICNILRHFACVNVIILGDPNYGACCIDDYTATELSADLLIHYGHSCLIPITSTTIKTLYIFVTIELMVDHFVDTIKTNLSKDRRVALMGTIQYSKSVALAYKQLAGYFSTLQTPQVKLFLK